MSRENIEIVRRWLEELPEDPEDFPAWVADLWESDGDYYPVRGLPEARPCHGREEIVRFVAEPAAPALWKRTKHVAALALAAAPSPAPVWIDHILGACP